MLSADQAPYSGYWFNTRQLASTGDFHTADFTAYPPDFFSIHEMK